MIEVAAEIVRVLEEADALGKLDDKIVQWVDNSVPTPA